MDYDLALLYPDAVCIGVAEDEWGQYIKVVSTSAREEGDFKGLRVITVVIDDEAHPYTLRDCCVATRDLPTAP